MDINIEELINAADQARKMAYAPYSKYKVGAALLCSDGSVYTGCNIENAAYGPSNCAERTAVFKAVSEGKRGFSAIAITGDSKKITTPCGVCRQVLSEFCPSEFMVIMANCDGDHIEKQLKDLLPLSFSASTMAE